MALFAHGCWHFPSSRPSPRRPTLAKLGYFGNQIAALQWSVEILHGRQDFFSVLWFSSCRNVGGEGGLADVGNWRIPQAVLMGVLLFLSSSLGEEGGPPSFSGVFPLFAGSSTALRHALSV